MTEKQLQMPESWIQTYNGNQVWPLEAVGDVCLTDIAHSLSQICRFNGHTRVFYSVAQHSVLASQLIAPQHAAWGLMHDAAEAYIGDLTRPIKRSVRIEMSPGVLRDINDIEADMLQRIALDFSLPWPPPWDEIENVDQRLLKSERRALMKHYGEYASWESKTVAEAVYISPESSPIAEARFLARALELGIQL